MLIKKTILLIIGVVFALGTYAQVITQDNASNAEVYQKFKGKVKILTQSGYIYKGYIMSLDNEKINLLQGSDTVHISVKNVYKVTEEKQKIRAKSRYNREIIEKMMLSPGNNFLEEGEIELSNYYIVFNQVKYGVSDRFNVGFGLSVLPSTSKKDSNLIVIDLQNQFYFLTQKTELIKKKRFNLSFNSFFLRIPNFDIDSTLTIKYPIQSFHFLTASYSTHRANFTASIGQAYFGGVRYGAAFNIFGSSIIGNTLSSQMFNAEYFAFVNVSYDVFKRFSIINENLFLSGLWNKTGNLENHNNRLRWNPIVGGRYYWDYYSSSFGIGPNLLYADVSYYF